MFALTLLLCSAAVTPGAPVTPPNHVYVGMFLTDVSDFDLKAGRFKADLHVWLKWLGDEAVPNMTFENGELDKQDVLSRENEGGWHSVHWRVQGTFRGEFPVHAFPFDRQTLPIVFGLNEAEGKLVPDLGASGMSPTFSVSGWIYEPQFAARSEERVFASDLGSVAREGKNAALRLASFSVEMRRPFGPYLIKFALPLALILLVALLALLLPPERLDVRSAMGITALLSCIAFHYTQADTLPNVTYLVAADKLFLGAYVFVAATLLLSIIAFRRHDRRQPHVHVPDHLGLWVLPSVTALGLVSLVSGALWRPEPVELAAPPNPHPSQPLLRVAVSALENAGGGGQLPPRRGLLVVRGADGTFRPVLAQEAPAMTNSLVRLLPDGGMRIRWVLRADARWSDGSRVTADDLAFSAALAPDPLRKAIEKVDARTIDITYSERHSDWLAGFAVYPKAASVFSADGGRDSVNRANNDGKLETCGAWALGEFEKGKRLTLVRNEHFGAMKPAFEKVEAKVYAPLDAARALLAHEVDLIPSLTADSYELLSKEKSVRVLEQPGDLLWVLVPNLGAAPWDSLEARQGLLEALDRSAMAKALAPAPTRVAWGWRPGLEGALPKSGSLAGVTKVRLHLAPIRSKDETHALLAQRVVEDLAKAGVTVELVEREEFFQAVQRGDFDGLALVSRDTTMPWRLLNVPTVAGWADLTRPVGPHFDQEMVERWERYETSLYAERRSSLETSLQKAWFARLPVVPLVLTSRLAAIRVELLGPEWGAADSLWWNVTEWHHQVPATAPEGKR